MKRLEAEGKLMYCSPIPPEQLDEVRMPDGRLVKAIRQAIPQGWDFERRRYVNHYTETPIVCAGLLASMAFLRGLGNAAHHPELTRMERCHGWIYGLDTSGQPIGKPYTCATRALDTAVRRKGNRIRAWGYDLGPPIEPFRPFAYEPHQYRSEQPAEFQDVYEITGTDWPDEVIIIKPFDQYASHQEWREDVLLKLDRL